MSRLLSATLICSILSCQFIEKFQEVKEATRSAAHQKVHNGTGGVGGPCPGSRGSHGHRLDGHSHDDGLSSANAHLLIDPMGLMSAPLSHMSDMSNHKMSLHQRSQSLSGLQVNKVRNSLTSHVRINSRMLSAGADRQS